MKTRKNTSKRKAMEVASQSHRAFHSTIQIEDYLRANIKRGNRTFFLTVKTEGLDALGIEIEPMLEHEPNNIYIGYVMRFNIEPKKAIDNLMKFLREKTNDRIDV